MVMETSSSSSRSDARSPFAGCAILVAAVLVMLFLIGFSTYALFGQYAEIERFTASRPVVVGVEALEGREGELNALAERLEVFREQVLGGEQALIDLTPGEMNLAIAAYEAFKDLRGSLRVESAGADGTLRLAISYRLNGKPRLGRDGEDWVTSDPRYLNGTLVTRPALTDGEVVLRIEAIEVPGGIPVPREFIDLMSPYRVAGRYVGDAAIGPAMGRLTRVEVADGKLRLQRVPGEKAAGAIERGEVDSASGRLFLFLGVAACVFLMIAGTVVFIGLRAKAAREGRR